MSCGNCPFLGLSLFYTITSVQTLVQTSYAYFISTPQNQAEEEKEKWSVKLTCSTKMLNLVSGPPPIFLRAVSTSFCNSLTAYSNVVLVSSTSSTMSMFLPTRFDISSEERSSHCVRVTFVPGASVGSAGSRDGRDS